MTKKLQTLKEKELAGENLVIYDDKRKVLDLRIQVAVMEM